VVPFFEGVEILRPSPDAVSSFQGVTRGGSALGARDRRENHLKSLEEVRRRERISTPSSRLC